MIPLPAYSEGAIRRGAEVARIMDIGCNHGLRHHYPVWLLFTASSYG